VGSAADRRPSPNPAVARRRGHRGGRAPLALGRRFRGDAKDWTRVLD